MKRARFAARLIRWTLKLLWRASPVEATALTGGLLLQSIIPTVTLLIIKQIIDTISSGITLDELAFLIVAWVFMLLLDMVLSPWIGVVQGNVGEKLGGYIDVLVIEKVATFSGLQYFEASEFYDEIEFIHKNTSWRPMNLLWYMLSVTRQILTIASIMVLLATIAWWVPFLLIVAALPQIIMYTHLQKQTYAALTANTKELRAMRYHRTVLTTDTYAKEVRIFDLTDFFTGRYLQAFRQAYVDIRRLRYKQAIWTTLLVLMGVGANAFAFYYSLQQTLAGVINVGSIVVFVQSLAVIQRHLADIAEFGASGLHENLLYMRRLFHFLQLEPDLNVSANQRVIDEPLQQIQFKDVAFTYPDGRQALSGINLTIKKGETVAIVGENGAGKTTLIKLLLRLYDPTSGQIMINNTPLTGLDLMAWRRKMAVVFQDFNQYALTLGENVVFDTDIPDDFDNIARQSGVRDVADTIGYDAMLGKKFNGTELSGGQWQKIALARAFVRRSSAELMILDEPTAALDPRSEYEIFQQFASLAQNKTTLLITHRLGSVLMADRILVMKQGQIIEDGTHHSLLGQDNEYAMLWQMQAEKYTS